MVAFIIAGIVAACSLALGLLGLFAASMSDAPGQTSGVSPYVIGGLVVASLIAASHFLPHVSW